MGGSSAGGTTTAPSISQEQKDAIQKIIDWTSPILDQVPAGQGFAGQLVADIPASFGQAFDQFTSGQFGDVTNQAIGDLISGKPAYEFNPVETQKQWQSTFATPVMEAWQDIQAPWLKEQMNVPGALYGRGTSDYLASKGNEFFGANVAPTLFNSLQAGENRGFQSAEAAAGRRFDATSLPFQQFGQRASAAQMFQQMQQAPLSAAYTEFQRVDPYRYASLLAGIGTAQTQQTVGTQGAVNPNWGAGLAAGGAAGLLASDMRVKENIIHITDALDKVEQLNGNTYNYIGNQLDNRNGGIMAQDLESVLLDAVSEHDGVKYVRYDAVIGLLVEAIKELNHKFEGANNG